VLLIEEAALLRMAACGELTDAKSLVALLLLQQWRSGAWTPTWQTSP
jgi:ADP-ribose pyrophosphatase